MIKVKYEDYYDDNNTHSHTITFDSMEEFQNWMFDQMRVEYENTNFPTKIRKSDGYLQSIRLTIDCGHSFYINLVETNDGIIFSDGKHTSNQYHISKSMSEFNKKCEDRAKAPKFNFIE